VDREVVLADVRQQVGAGAQHITFGDPDFFNGVGHAVPLVEALHREFPELTYDVTIKIEHLRDNQELLKTLKQTGCLFVVSAVESLDDGILGKLEKGHSRADFLEVVKEFRRAGLTLQPTFVPFTPWTTFENYLDLLEQLQRLDLVAAVAPIQLAIRLLVTAGSRLLQIEEIRQQLGEFDAKTLTYPWRHGDPAIDQLSLELQAVVEAGEKSKQGRGAIFERIWMVANQAAGRATKEGQFARATTWQGVPYLNEPWYC
jgi:hypothetical protein